MRSGPSVFQLTIVPQSNCLTPRAGTKPRPPYLILLLLRWDLSCLEQPLRGPISQTCPRHEGKGPMRICFSSSQMNAIGGFSARLNGFRLGHPSRMTNRQKQGQDREPGVPAMSNIPLDLQRSCEERWAARFLRPLASAAPQKHGDAKRSSRSWQRQKENPPG